MLRRLVLPTIALVLGACASEPEQQWYKPGVDYTMADFARDQKACTKERKLDEPCMRQRGWVPLSGDAPPPKPVTPDPRRPRY